MNQEEILALGATLRNEVDSGMKSHSEAMGEMEKANSALSDKLSSVEGDVKALQSRMVVDMPGVDEEKETFSFAKAFKGISTGDWGKGFEKTVFQESAKKALSVGAPTAGGYTVPQQFVRQIIELLRANMAVAQAGATLITPSNSTPIDIPRQSGGATAYWVGENAEITSSQLSTDQVTLSPNMVAALTKSSRRLINLADVDPGIEMMIRNDLAKALGLEIDIKAMFGTGASNTPVGIVNQVGVGTFEPGTNGDDFTYDFALNMEGQLDDVNALNGSLCYIAHPKVIRRLKQQTTAGPELSPIFAPIVSNTKLADNLGYPFYTSTQVNTAKTKGTGTGLSDVIFGNFDDLIMAQWGSMVLESSTTAGDGNGGAFSSHQVWFKAIMEVDFAVRHPESFIVAPFVKTTA